MKLSKIAILALKGCGKSVYEKIAEAIDCNLLSVYRYIANNDDNLTKAASLKIIREETGLTDQEILEEETEVKTRA